MVNLQDQEQESGLARDVEKTGHKNSKRQTKKGYRKWLGWYHLGCNWSFLKYIWIFWIFVLFTKKLVKEMLRIRYCLIVKEIIILIFPFPFLRHFAFQNFGKTECQKRLCWWIIRDEHHIWPLINWLEVATFLLRNVTHIIFLLWPR